MKKIFLLAFGIFAFALMFSFQTENNNLIKNSAFADGTCCPETSSQCIMNGRQFYDRYYKAGGSCKATTELEMAP